MAEHGLSVAHQNEHRGPSRNTKRRNEKSVARNLARHVTFFENQRRIQQEVERKRKEAMARAQARRTAKFHKDLAALVTGPARELQERTDKLLQLHAEKEQLKSAKLHHTWEEQVFNKISTDINSKIDRINPHTLHRQRREEYSKFLAAANTKANGLFLDEVDQSEYDPFTVNQRALRVATGKLDDPTLRAVVKTQEERLQGPERRKGPTCRETLDVKLWRSGMIESTPNGHFAAHTAAMALAGAGGMSEEPCARATFKPGFINHFAVPVGRDVTDREFPKGKRTFTTTRR